MLNWVCSEFTRVPDKIGDMPFQREPFIPSLCHVPLINLLTQSYVRYDESFQKSNAGEQCWSWVTKNQYTMSSLLGNIVLKYIPCKPLVNFKESLPHVLFCRGLDRDGQGLWVFCHTPIFGQVLLMATGFRPAMPSSQASDWDLQNWSNLQIYV